MSRLRSNFWLLVSAITPLFVVLSAIRLALTPLFFSLEYQLPGFPPDAYGFTLVDRMAWADFSIEYLLGRIPHQTLAQAVIADGSPLFNDRELLHMLDVKNLTTAALTIWYITLLVVITGILVARKNKEWGAFLTAIQHGAAATLIALFTILLGVWLNFNWLFTKFHEIFFEGDSWLFHPTDHLIRLFPLRFWQDLFLFIGAVSGLISMIVLLAARIYRSRKARSS